MRRSVHILEELGDGTHESEPLTLEEINRWVADNVEAGTVVYVDYAGCGSHDVQLLWDDSTPEPLPPPLPPEDPVERLPIPEQF